MPAVPSKNARPQPQRIGSNTLEVTVALVLLGLTATAVGKFVSQVHVGLRQRQLSQQIGWELENIREQVATWKSDSITAERIENLPIAPALAEQLENPRWHAIVSTIDQPLPVKQVSLSFEYVYLSQSSSPAGLTFWIPLTSDSSKEAAIDQGVSNDAP